MNISKEKNIMHNCSKFNSINKEMASLNKAMCFIKLRKQGCLKKPAIQFCSKKICKSDSTKSFDGPLSFRTLKKLKIPNLLLNVILLKKEIFIFFFFYYK